MDTFHFVMVLGAATPYTENLESRLFEAGCDDALVCGFNNTVYLEFDREAVNANIAMKSAIENIAEAGFSVKSIQEAELATMADIAKLADTTRASISNYVSGKRGGGDFPGPISGITYGSPLFSWPEVAEWLYTYKKLDEGTYEVAKAAAELKQNELLLAH